MLDVVLVLPQFLPILIFGCTGHSVRLRILCNVLPSATLQLAVAAGPDGLAGAASKQLAATAMLLQLPGAAATRKACRCGWPHA